MAIQTFAVIGAGTMGNGIAQVAATAGLQVCLIDTLPAQLDRARSAITKSLAKFVEKGVIPAEQKDQALARITTATTLEAVGNGRLRRGGRLRGLRREVRDLRPPGQDLPAGGDPGQQHLLHRHHPPRGGDRAGRTGSSACTS